MKINGTIFSKPQQDQLKRAIGAEYTQYSLDLSTQSGRDRLINLCQVANQGKKITLKKVNSGDIYPIIFVTESAVNFGVTTLNVSGDIDAQSTITIKCKASSANQYLLRIPVNGTPEKNTFTVSNVILFIEN